MALTDEDKLREIKKYVSNLESELKQCEARRNASHTEEGIAYEAGRIYQIDRVLDILAVVTL